MKEIKQWTDEALAARAAAGARASFSELVARYSPRLYRFLRHRAATDQDAEDLVQETFLKTFKNLERFDGSARFSTWLYTTAVRLAISAYRKKRPQEKEQHPIDSAPGPLESASRKETVQNLWAQARALGKGQYEALWLRYTEGYSVKEIAGIMNRSPIHVRVLLHRARCRLARSLEDRPEGSAKDPGTLPGKGLSYL